MVERQPHPSNRNRRLRPPTDYVLADSAEEQGDYEVAPAAGKSVARINLDIEPPRPETADIEQDEDLPREPPLQFSTLDLLVIFTFASIGLAAVQWWPPAYFAGVAGGVASLALLIVVMLKPTGRLSRFATWAIVTVYFFAAVGAVVAVWQADRGGSVDQPPASQQSPQGDASDTQEP